MELNLFKSRILPCIQKYKYVACILLVGIVLMLLPAQGNNDTAVSADPSNSIELSVSQRLEQILENIQGAGKVHVMLTQAEGERTIYATEGDTTTSENTITNRVKIITVTDAQRAQTGLITQVIPPVYLGAIVVCEGADSPSVRLEITQAVSKITGLGMDRISVLKMK